MLVFPFHFFPSQLSDRQSPKAKALPAPVKDQLCGWLLSFYLLLFFLSLRCIWFMRLCSSSCGISTSFHFVLYSNGNTAIKC